MPDMTLDRKDLPLVAQELAGQARRLVLPVREAEEVFYREGADPSQLDLSTIPKNSIKEFFFPKCEKILEYQYEGSDLTVEDVNPESTPAVIFCARPCDAASLPVVDSLWNWDYKDKFFNQRRSQTLLVTYACRRAPDEACFCMSVGLSPSSDQGADVMLYPIDDDRVVVRFVSPEGKQVEGVFSKFKRGESPEEVLQNFEREAEQSLSHRKRLDKVQEWLEGHFDDSLWEEKAFRCIGCGTCTFLCPTCHCFDIQDESVFDAGCRLKNWDGCQFSLFTLHTSGHNPRDVQAKRYRQRIFHKYAVYPEKFGKILCTGCGRCVAHCPVNLSLYDVVAAAQERAEKGD